MQCLITSIVFFFVSKLVSCYIDPVIIVQGGTNSLNISRVKERAQGVKRAALAGYKIMQNGGSVTDAVETAVKTMEEDDHFNAGYGSRLNLNGEVEMDAGIMVGANLSSGAVSGLKNFEHPVSAARLVMDNSPHFLLVGEGANSFAKDTGMPYAVAGALVSEEAKRDFADYLKFRAPGAGDLPSSQMADELGGGGAVAVDSNGHVAAAGSTGGQLGRYPGTVDNIALPGLGMYADDEIGAVVVTGSSLVKSLSRFGFKLPNHNSNEFVVSLVIVLFASFLSVHSR